MAELVREIMIDATPETIWPFLTDPGKHVEWEGTVADIDPRPGGVYRVLVAGQYQSAGEFVEVVPMAKVVFTFGWEQENNPIAPGSTEVEITLHPEGDEDPRAARAPRPARRAAVERPRRADGGTTSSGSRCVPPAAIPGRTGDPGRCVMDIIELHDRALEATHDDRGQRRRRPVRRADAVCRVRRARVAEPHGWRQLPLREDRPRRTRRGHAGDRRFRARRRTHALPRARRPRCRRRGATRCCWSALCICPSATFRERLRSASTRSRRSCTVGTSPRPPANRPRSNRRCTRWRGRTPRTSMTASVAPAGHSGRLSRCRPGHPTPRR